MYKKINNLDCFGDRKSFYNKCHVIMDNEHIDKNIYLLSYNTIVCYVDNEGNFYRLWDGESTTTMRHINAFLKYVGIDGGGVAWWRKQAEAPNDIKSKMDIVNYFVA